MRSPKLKGVHRVIKKKNGRAVGEYHYAFRGGPCFWKRGNGVEEGSDEYLANYLAAKNGFDDRLRKAPTAALPTTQETIELYRNSAAFVTLAERTRKDYQRYLDALEAEFGADPIKMFEERESLSELSDWKQQWAHSPKQFDYATTVVTRLLNWADENGKISGHFHRGIRRAYRADRADIIWLPQEIDALLEGASEVERRIVIAASEGGITPQDLGRLKREHVQQTPSGRRLFFRRAKTSNPVSIPVTPGMAWVIDTTPAEQTHLLVSLTGLLLEPERASGIVRDLKIAANARWPGSIREELRLYDMRGTAATQLLRAGCGLNEIAVTMGWGLRHAANVIEAYAALVPEVADEVREKLERAARRARASRVP